MGLVILALCLASSSTYALNDVLDAEADRNHPTKKDRPVASGALSPKLAIGIYVLLLIASFAIAWLINRDTVIGLGIFLAIHFLYNGFFKKVAVLDTLFISLAFVQRAALGAMAIHVKISGWLLFVSGALALLLAFAKRRHEFGLPQEADQESRVALRGYSQPLLDHFVMFSAGLSAFSYGVYAIESPTAKHYPSLILTIPVVLFGIMRYLTLVFKDDEGGEPESLLLKDKPLLGSVVVFMVLSVLCLSVIKLPFLLSASQ